MLLSISCSSTTGTVSIHDTFYFSEEPKIVTKEDRFFLRFRYGAENHFYTNPSSKIEGDSLIFYLVNMTSTGDASGKLQFEEILSEEKIKLVKEGSAYWEEPGSKLVPLKVEVMEESFDVVWNKRLKH